MNTLPFLMKEKYRRVKEDIRNMKSQKNDAEKDKMDRTRQKNQNVSDYQAQELDIHRVKKQFWNMYKND